MRISGLGFAGTPAFGHLRIRQAAVETGVAPVSRQAENRDLLKLAELLQGLRGALEGSTARIGASRGGSVAGALRLSSVSLDLGSTSPARLRSSEEVNTIATSFGPFGPDWTGSSGSVVTLGGVYDGDQGDQNLTFRSTIGGVVGLSPVRIDVFNEGGTRVDRIDFGIGYSAGTPITLQNGLTLAQSRAARSSSTGTRWSSM